MIANLIEKITQVRSEYTSARLILANLEHRLSGSRSSRSDGYNPPEIDYTTIDGQLYTISIRDYDVRYLDRVSLEKALSHINLIHQARKGNSEAKEELKRMMHELYPRIAARFDASELTENEYVIPYTTTKTFSEIQISNKGALLLDLFRRGFATADFVLLSASAYKLDLEERKKCIADAIHDLEKLSGRTLGSPDNPLLIAVRSAMPEYMPGFMPTYLNVGLTPDVLPGLPKRYGIEAAMRIRLNNRKTLLEVIDPQSFMEIEKNIKPHLSLELNNMLVSKIESIIEKYDRRLLVDPHEQILFFIGKAYEYYENHFDTLRNFMGKKITYPSVILQRMVCSVIDENSYAGVLYSNHPRKRAGVHLQFARTIYGEELMTGRLRPEIMNFITKEEAKKDFPAIFHFWQRLDQLVEIFKSPVMVEFTGVYGTFTILQVNQAELSGVGMLTAVMDLYRDKRITAERVRELIKPYHVRQIESDAIDPNSLQNLIPFCRGFSVLPRSAISGRLYFSGTRARIFKELRSGDNIILLKERFNPTDAIKMQTVQGIASINPAAIHVVTAAQNLGIPALVNLEEDGVCLDSQQRLLTNKEGKVLKEGDWVTISSRNKTLYIGKAVFAPARLLRFMSGDKVELTEFEKELFEQLADYYREYRLILENVEASEFESLQDLGYAIRYGKLQGDVAKAAAFVNQCFELNLGKIIRRLLASTLGTHLVNFAAFELLTLDHQVLLLKAAIEMCQKEGLFGYQAGAFVIGSFVTSRAPVDFWKAFQPDEIAMLISEWLYHQKYLVVLDNIGERKVRRAKDEILAHGLGNLRLHDALVSEFIKLKLGKIDLIEVQCSIPVGCDEQTYEVIELLKQPYSVFYDYTKPWSLDALKRICEAEKIPVPAPHDI